ncbi:MAG: hypothetical protein WBD27_04445 [Pyrinomonadaceae bacterium]
MARKSWWATTLADQSAQLLNFSSKIGGYAGQLGWTPAQVTAAQNVCATFINAVNFTEGARASMLAATQWREMIFFGEPNGALAPPTPNFPDGGDFSFTLGVVTQFFALREQIVANSKYTMAMGEDLGIVGAEIIPLAPTNVTPNLKASVSMGNTVNLTGSMQGMDALRVEYAPKGGDFTTVAFLTKTPGGFQITPTNPSGAETGFVRAVFIKKNEEYGNFSPNYPVTVS